MPPPAEGLASRLFLGPALRAQPDRRLVTLVREGYEAAFEEIVRRYGRPLGRYAASIVGARSEDVLQDAFAKALPALRRDDDAEIDLRPWLFRIVRNTALNDLRDSPPSAEILAEALAGGTDPATELERREELADLIKRLGALPEAQRAAIVMRELEGLGHDEIAAALGMSGGGARQAIYRARRALRDGAGILLPLPLLRLLIEHGGEAAAAGAGGGAIAAAGATAGGAGAGGAVKAGVVAAVLAGSVGAGVAVQDQHDGDATAAGSIPAARGSTPAPASPAVGLAAISTAGSPSGGERRGERRGGSDRGEDGDSHGQGEDRTGRPRGSRHGGHGPRPGRRGPRGGRHEGPRGGPHRGGGPGPGGRGEHSGPGRGGDDFAREGRHGDGDRRGPGDGDGDVLRSPDDSVREDRSGPDDGSDPPPEQPPPDDDGSGGSGDSGVSGGADSGGEIERSGSGSGER